MISPSEHSLAALEKNGASQAVIDVAIRMAECLRRAGDDVANSTGKDLFDDDTSRGFLLYRRAHNRMIAEFNDDEGVRVESPDNALHIGVDGCVFSFYSSRDGIDRPSIGGTSRTKRRVVDEMQMQIDGIDTPKVRRLVLMHQSDEEGVVAAAAGVLRGSRQWAWQATLYDRLTPGVEAESAEQQRGYEEQEEPALPPIERRQDSAVPPRQAEQREGS